MEYQLNYNINLTMGMTIKQTKDNDVNYEYPGICLRHSIYNLKLKQNGAELRILKHYSVEKYAGIFLPHLAFITKLPLVYTCYKL